jgi:hypothetical protein
MQSPIFDRQNLNSSVSESLSTTEIIDYLPENPATIGNVALNDTLPMTFQARFDGYMDMYAEIDSVAAYLDNHQEWFCRCAQPLQTVALDEQSYLLTIGRFGSFGFEVDARIAVALQPPENWVYQMHTLNLPEYPTPHYEVDYRARMELVEVAATEIPEIAALFKKKKHLSTPKKATKVNWDLNLTVSVQFPKFIHRLPQSIIQSTGDRLLAQIVGQISPRLTQKVQKDFHSGLNLPIPPKSGRKWIKLDKNI